MNLHFHSDQRKKTNKWSGNMLMFHVDINMKRLGIRFKNNVSMIQIRLFLLRDNKLSVSVSSGRSRESSLHQLITSTYRNMTPIAAFLYKLYSVLISSFFRLLRSKSDGEFHLYGKAVNQEFSGVRFPRSSHQIQQVCELEREFAALIDISW